MKYVEIYGYNFMRITVIILLSGQKVTQYHILSFHVIQVERIRANQFQQSLYSSCSGLCLAFDNVHKR